VGEIADLMIEGGLCAMCGVYEDGMDEPGFPLYCSRDCAPDDETWKTSKEYLKSAK